MSPLPPCGICWSRDNLSDAQRLDRANLPTGTMLLCNDHQASMDRMTASLVDFLVFTPAVKA